MSIFHRTFVSFYAKIDNLVGEIENHDALIKAAIGEQKQKLSAAKIELRRLEQYQDRLQKEIKQCEQNDALWTERAAQEAGQSEEKALLCLQRRQTLREKKERLMSIQKEHHSSLAQLQRNISEGESDLNRMVQKHQLMRARQSTSEVMSVIDKHSVQNSGALAESFDRWEIQIAKNEIDFPVADEADLIEREYVARENEEALRHELAELLKQKKMDA